MVQKYLAMVAIPGAIALAGGIGTSNLIIRSRFHGQVHINAISTNKARGVEQVINQKISQYTFGYGDGGGRGNGAPQQGGDQ